ncbi:hypothetical protein CDAR_501201 [Caerostris darwini]|uniref:Uncharacterized protein n=1 Tax=Caerostris darwini TaxID=1538125 RepID=A0AAV4NSC4_9ARAC|nr:hypothetical protein CDAR_501201 [Caerostris darwini]
MPKVETSTSADTRDTSPAEKGKLCLPTESIILFTASRKDTFENSISSMPKVETSTSADTRDTSPAAKGKLCLSTERYLSSISRK